MPPVRQIKVRTPQQVQIDRLRMVKMMRRGMTPRQISEVLQVGEGTIYNDWKIVLKDLDEVRSKETDQLVSLKLEELAEVKTEAWNEWERSKRNYHKHQREGTDIPVSVECPHCKGTGHKPNHSGSMQTSKNLPPCTHCQGKGHKVRPQKVTKTQAGRLGDSKYLRIILDCIEAERELQSLNPAKRIEGNVNVIQWEMLAQGIPLDDQVEDKVEVAIQRALNYTDQLAQKKAEGQTAREGMQELIIPSDYEPHTTYQEGQEQGGED